MNRGIRRQHCQAALPVPQLRVEVWSAVWLWGGQASAEKFKGMNRVIFPWTEQKEKKREEREDEERAAESRDTRQVLNRILLKATVRS